jgi:hypothetical protein
MTYDADTATGLEFERLRFKQRRYAERAKAIHPAIKMLIGDWYDDEFARNYSA